MGEILQSEPLTGSQATKEVSFAQKPSNVHPRPYFDHLGLNWYPTRKIIYKSLTVVNVVQFCSELELRSLAFQC